MPHSDILVIRYVAPFHPLPKDLTLTVAGSGPPSKASFIGPSRQTTASGISNQSAVFSQFKFAVVTNGRTDRPTDRPAERKRNSTGTNRPLTLHRRRGLTTDPKLYE